MRRWTTGLTAVAVAVAAAVTPPQAAAATARAAPAAQPGSADRTTVTLVTGDRVHLVGSPDARPIVRVEPGQDRKGVAFYRHTRDGELSVVPSDAAPLVMAGRLDAALFNVTRLLRDGYGDGAREDIPLIVAGTPGRRAASLAGGTAARPLAALNGAAVTARKDRTASLWSSLTRGRSAFSPEVSRVWLDGKVRATLDRSVPKIGAPDAWRAGYTGKGVTVGVLDSGIDAAHPDLEGAVAASRDFTGEGDVKDRTGHGTHVASTITGDGAPYRGVAPDARLIVGKVLDAGGNGSYSAVIAGMEWIAGQGAKVVNVSLGAAIPSDGTDPMSAAVNALTARTGTLFVVGAGNEGADGSVLVPGLADAALTVGATDLDDRVAGFSSRGPRPGDGAIKPDVVAPGVGIAAARAEGTEPGEPVGDRHVRMNGTSMAAPHVAGAAALLLQRHPDWKPAQVKARLMNSARPDQAASVFAQGAGRIDLRRALDQRISTDQGSVSFDLRKNGTRQVTFRNDGDAPVKLDLALKVTGPDDQQAPAGMFTATPGTLEIPAGGTAAATLTADPAEGTAGRYSGALTATNGDQEVLRLPVGAVKEPPLHEVRLTGIDRTGRPAGSAVETLPWVKLVDLRTGEEAATFVSGNGVAARVPTGRYALNAVVPTGVDDYTLVSYPALTVDRDLTVTADARRARKVAAKVDSPTAVRSGMDEMGVIETIAGQVHSFGVAVTGTTALSAVPTAKADQRQYRFYHVSLLHEPDGPRAYHLQFLTDGRVPSRTDRRVRDAELAAVRSFYHADKPLTGWRDNAASIPGLPFGGGSGSYPVRLPGERTELYTASPDLRWSRFLSAGAEDQGIISRAPAPPADRPGRAAEHWNNAALGSLAGGQRKGRNGRMIFQADPFAAAGARTHRVSPLTQRISVLRDGTPLGSADSGVVQVVTPPGPARYTVRSTAERAVSSTDLGTRSEAEWTFPYTPTQEAQEEVPLFAVRMDGRFGLDNRAPAGAPFTLDMRITDSGLLTTWEPPEFDKPTLEASYDDGKSWHPAPVTTRAADRWTARLDHRPLPGGHVSLRVRLSDGAGASLDQTMIRAYGLR